VQTVQTYTGLIAQLQPHVDGLRDETIEVICCLLHYYVRPVNVSGLVITVVSSSKELNDARELLIHDYVGVVDLALGTLYKIYCWLVLSISVWPHSRLERYYAGLVMLVLSFLDTDVPGSENCLENNPLTSIADHFGDVFDFIVVTEPKQVLFV